VSHSMPPPPSRNAAASPAAQLTSPPPPTHTLHLQVGRTAAQPPRGSAGLVPAAVHAWQAAAVGVRRCIRRRRVVARGSGDAPVSIDPLGHKVLRATEASPQ
jgi:hypothetical protein